MWHRLQFNLRLANSLSHHFIYLLRVLLLSLLQIPVFLILSNACVGMWSGLCYEKQSMLYFWKCLSAVQCSNWRHFSAVSWLQNLKYLTPFDHALHHSWEWSEVWSVALPHTYWIMISGFTHTEVYFYIAATRGLFLWQSFYLISCTQADFEHCGGITNPSISVLCSLEDCRFSAVKGASLSWSNIRDGINLTVEIAKVYEDHTGMMANIKITNNWTFNLDYDEWIISTLDEQWRIFSFFSFVFYTAALTHEDL